jgi:hypothetical protein
MRGELEGGISVGGIRIMVTLHDLGKDRKVTSLNSMSAGGHSFGGTLLSYTQLPESFFEAPGSSCRLEDTIVKEFTVSKRLALTRQLWGYRGFMIDTSFKCSGPIIFPLACRISEVKAHSAILGEIKLLLTVVLPPGSVPPSQCKGEVGYAWATALKLLKIDAGGESVEVIGEIGQGTSDVMSIEKWCPSVTTECDPVLGTLSFPGIVLGASIDRGTLYPEWGEASLIPFHESSSFDCKVPVYNVFLANAPFNFTNILYQNLLTCQ